jgi:hypothetical protein
MLNTATANSLVNEVVYTIDNLYKHKNVPQQLLNYLYLAFTGLLLNYGSKCVDELYKVLERIDFVYGEYSIYNTFSSEELNRIKEINLFDNFVYTRINGFEYSANLNISYMFSFMVKSDGDIEKLEFIVKEINNLFLMNCDKSLLSKVIKTLQTENAIKSVFEFTKDFDIYNPKFVTAISYFKDFDYNNYVDSENEQIVNLYRPLYHFNYIKNLFNELVINGNSSEMSKDFDNILGKNSFTEMQNKITYIDYALHSNAVGSKISHYELAKSYLNIRNNFIRKYIELKFNTDHIYV